MSRNRRGRRESKNIIKFNSKLIFLLIPIILICIVVLGIKITKTNEEKKQALISNNEIYNANIEFTEEEKESIENASKTDIHLKISAIGNILCENNILNSVKNNEYNFSNIFKNIKKYTTNADITIAPIETNFVNQEYSGNKNYNAHKNLAKEIKNIGTDIAFLANNHSMDYGINGVKETSSYLKEINLEIVGIKEDENASNIIIKEYRNIKIAFLTYTYGTNKKEEGYEKYVNLINKEVIQNDIKLAKDEGAEYLIVGMHWGNVVGSSLNSEQKELTDFLVNSGIDIIIGNHPSSLQKMETRVNQDGKDVLIVYSMGNLISSENYKNYNLGMILNIELIKLAEDNKVYLNKVSYVPTYIQDNGVNSEKRYEVLDIKEEISDYENGIKNINEKTYNKLKYGLVKIRELINGK